MLTHYYNLPIRITSIMTGLFLELIQSKPVISISICLNEISLT